MVTYKVKSLHGSSMEVKREARRLFRSFKKRAKNSCEVTEARQLWTSNCRSCDQTPSQSNWQQRETSTLKSDWVNELYRLTETSAWKWPRTTNSQVTWGKWKKKKKKKQPQGASSSDKLEQHWWRIRISCVRLEGSETKTNRSGQGQRCSFC